MKTINIENFKGLKVELDYKEIMDKHANKCKNDLISTSPSTGRPNRKTPYKNGWTVETFPVKGKYALRVWNKTNWQLTHLLENGHFITNNGALKWARAKKHIYPAYVKMRDPYIREMEKAKLKVDFK